MRKYITFINRMILLLINASCSENHSSKYQQLERQIAELKNNAYVPELDEFMNTHSASSYQLWFERLDQN